MEEEISVSSQDLISGNTLQGVEIGREELSVIGSLLDRSIERLTLSLIRILQRMSFIVNSRHVA